MGALLDDGASIEDDQPVEVSDGAEAVGDGEHRLPFHQILQTLLNGVLDLAVQGRGRLVQDQDGGVLHEYPGEGEPLPLASRQAHAPLADVGVESPAALGVPELGHEVVRVGEAEGALYLGLGGVGPSVDDVLAH